MSQTVGKNIAAHLNDEGILPGAGNIHNASAGVQPGLGVSPYDMTMKNTN